MKNTMLRTTGCLCAAMLAIASPAHAAILFTGGPIVSDFNGLPPSGVTQPTPLASPFSATVGVQAIVTGSGGWEATKLSGTGTTPMPFLADNGTGNSGAIYSYGAPQATERALGSLASGSNVPGYGVQIINNTAANIVAITVRFTQENWRNSTSSTATPNTVNASYGTTDSGVTASTFLSTATGFTDVDLLDLVGPVPVVTQTPLDGNNALNQVPRVAVIPALVGPGESFYLRFQDINEQGNDAGLAIDEVNFAFVIPEPATLFLAGLSLMAVGLTRTRK